MTTYQEIRDALHRLCENEGLQKRWAKFENRKVVGFLRDTCVIFNTNHEEYDPEREKDDILVLGGIPE